MWRMYYLIQLMKDKKGIGVVEVILILVVNCSRKKGSVQSISS